MNHNIHSILYIFFVKSTLYSNKNYQHFLRESFFRYYSQFRQHWRKNMIQKKLDKHFDAFGNLFQSY